jgi:hypothetical protein
MRAATKTTIFFLTLVTGYPAIANEPVTSLRDQRCLDMRLKLEAAERKRSGYVSAEVEKLRSLAAELCAKGKQAQGIRAYANAVDLLER